MSKTAVFVLAILSILSFQNCAPNSSNSASEQEQLQPSSPELGLSEGHEIAVNQAEVILKPQFDGRQWLDVDVTYSNECSWILGVVFDESGAKPRVRVIAYDGVERTGSCGQMGKMPTRETYSIRLSDWLEPGNHVVEYLSVDGIKELAVTVN